MTTIQELIDRREQAEAELREIKAEIAARAGETDESLDPDPAKALTGAAGADEGEKAAPAKAAPVKKG